MKRNSIGRVPSPPGLTGRASLENLRSRHGSSFYLLDIEAVRGNFREFLSAFRSIYPSSSIAYSYKTCYTPAVLREVQALGAYAEVVSRMEYDIARRIGVEPKRIVFNGPLKSEEDIALALENGSMLNLDSMYEVSIVASVARQFPGRTFAVALRCNLDDELGLTSRFGFSVADGSLNAAAERIRALPNCTVEGLHCHYLIPGRSTEGYHRLARTMIAASDRVSELSPLRFVNVGGGFFSKMSPEMMALFDAPVPTFEEYARAVATPFRDRYSDGNGPELILEPGLAIVADVMRFVTPVVEIKKMGDRTIALTAGSIYNIRPTKSKRNLPVSVVRNSGGLRQDGPLDIVGYTCMEDDIMYAGYPSSLAVGDILIFENVGAYSLVLKPPFILPSPPVLAFESGETEPTVVRRHETVDDILTTYL